MLDRGALLSEPLYDLLSKRCPAGTPAMLSSFCTSKLLVEYRISCNPSVDWSCRTLACLLLVLLSVTVVLDSLCVAPCGASLGLGGVRRSEGDRSSRTARTNEPPEADCLRKEPPAKLKLRRRVSGGCIASQPIQRCI